MSSPRIFAIVALVLFCLTTDLKILRIESASGQTIASEPRTSFYEPAISPDDSEIAFISGDDIWTVPLNGGEARLLVSDAAEESRPLYSPDGRRLAFISDRTGNGDIYLLTFATGELTRLTFDDGAEQLDAWSRDGRWIYFTSSSQDISGMSDVFRVSVEGGTPMAVTSERYVNEFWAAPSPDGKSLAFNARGISDPPGGRQTPPVGHLGLRFDRTEFESAGRLKVTEVIDLGPAAISGQIKAGDFLVSVDGEAIDARTDLNRLLENKVNRRVELVIAPASGDRKTIVVRPVNLGTVKGLLYRHWVNGRRAYVERISGGRLGYVHMFDMSANSLSQLYADLDILNHAKDGVVIDVRNNNGGFVNAYAIDVFARRGYMTMTVRGFPSAPARTVLGQRALERPTILVTNQHSLSDAEDFTEGYRSLKLGKVVGEPTAGWIIYTWNTALIDGSRFRLPRQKVQDSSGQDMELHPRPVDLNVVRLIGEGARDSQLDAAVRELLKQLGR